MHKLEALALAIAHQNQALEPGSEAFCNLNPGLLKTHDVTPDGTRSFTSFQGGYRALLANLEAKCHGKPRLNGQKGKLGPESTLLDLCKTFRYLQARKLVDFLQDALEDRAVNERTPLSFFMENLNG